MRDGARSGQAVDAGIISVGKKVSDLRGLRNPNSMSPFFHGRSTFFLPYRNAL